MANMTAVQGKAKCVAAGCDPGDCDKLETAAPGIDWATLLQLIATYGPQIVAVLLALFGKGPMPSPLPAPVVPTP